MKKLFNILLLLVLLLMIPGSVFARLGVGIGTGKIVVDEKLRSGVIYTLPPITIVNTGDETSDYKVSIAYHSDQKELRPAKDWFIFSPEVFKLKEGESQVVEVKLNLPLKTEPGTYFAYIEGSPTIAEENGKSRVGIAAAAKLYFEIQPSNIFEAIYYKVLSFFKVYAPWPQRVAIGLGVVVSVLLLKKFLNIEISFKKKDSKKNDKGDL